MIIFVGICEVHVLTMTETSIKTKFEETLVSKTQEQHKKTDWVLFI